MKYSVSVVMPVYNGQGVVVAAIDSVLAQSLRADEIIVVDDGSTDATAEVVKGYGDKVRYIYQENGGVSAACNTGIRAAECEWVTFLDSDDLWLADNLEQQVGLLRRNPDLMWVRSNYYIVDGKSNSKRLQVDLATVKDLLGSGERFNFFDGAVLGAGWSRCSVMIRRDVFDEVGLYRQGYSAGEDLDFSIRMAFVFPEIGFVDRPLAVYSFGAEGSLSAGPCGGLIMSRCENLGHILEMSEQYGKRADVERLAKVLLVSWIRKVLGSGERQLARDILDRFGYLLSKNFKREVRFRIAFPRFGGLCFHLYFKFKKILKFHG